LAKTDFDFETLRHILALGRLELGIVARQKLGKDVAEVPWN
jgi:hypothetical protein